MVVVVGAKVWLPFQTVVDLLFLRKQCICFPRPCFIYIYILYIDMTHISTMVRDGVKGSNRLIYCIFSENDVRENGRD